MSAETLGSSGSEPNPAYQNWTSPENAKKDAIKFSFPGLPVVNPSSVEVDSPNPKSSSDIVSSNMTTDNTEPNQDEYPKDLNAMHEYIVKKRQELFAMDDEKKPQESQMGKPNNTESEVKNVNEAPIETYPASNAIEENPKDGVADLPSDFPTSLSSSTSNWNNPLPTPINSASEDAKPGGRLGSQQPDAASSEEITGDTELGQKSGLEMEDGGSGYIDMPQEDIISPQYDYPIIEDSNPKPTSNIADSLTSRSFLGNEPLKPQTDKPSAVDFPARQALNDAPKDVRKSSIESSTSEKVDDSEEATPENTKNAGELSVTQRLETAQKELEGLLRSLHYVRKDEPSINETVAAYETELNKSRDEIEYLAERTKELKKEVSRTKNKIISGFIDGLNLAKDMLFGEHDKIQDRMHRLTDRINAYMNQLEEVEASYDETREQLGSKRNAKSRLDEQYQDALAQKRAIKNETLRLSKQIIRKRKLIELLKEQSTNEAWTEAWEDAQDDIVAEMGYRNVREYRADISAKLERAYDDYNEELRELRRYKEPSDIDKAMKTEQQLKEEAEKARALEPTITEKHSRKIIELEDEIAKIDKYFPTWLDRISRLRENKPVSGALSALKRKALIALYSAA